MVRTSAAEVHSHIHVNSVTIVPAISVWQLRGMDQWLLGAARPTKAVFHSIPSLPNQPQFHLQFHPPPLRTNKRPAGWKSFVDTLQTPPTPPMGFICWCRHFALANDFRPRVCIVMALGISPSTISYYQKVLTNFSVVTRPPNALSRINIARMQFSGRMDANCRGQKLL